MTAIFLWVNLKGLGPEVPWQVLTLVAFAVFVGIVAWGWGTSEFRLHRMRERERYLTVLSALRQQGLRLQIEGWHEVRHEKAALEHWWNRVQAWNANVQENMRHINRADPDNWTGIGTYETRSFDEVSDDLARRFLTMLAIRLEKLERYIDDRTKKGSQP